MKLEELTDKIGDFILTDIVPQMKGSMTLFALGAAASASGRKIIAAHLKPIAALVSDEQGEIDIVALKDAALGGIRTSKTLTLPGGLVTVNENDIERFFSKI